MGGTGAYLASIAAYSAVYRYAASNSGPAGGIGVALSVPPVLFGVLALLLAWACTAAGVLGRRRLATAGIALFAVAVVANLVASYIVAPD